MQVDGLPDRCRDSNGLTLDPTGSCLPPANAHETQWDVTDPVTDIVSMSAIFPAVISAAQVLNTDQRRLNVSC